MLLLFLACLIGSIDLFDLVTRTLVLRRRARHARSGRARPIVHAADRPEHSAAEVRGALEPYVIVASVYNATRILPPFLEAMRAYRHQLWLIDDASTDGTPEYLEREGIRCIAASVNRKKPGALRELVARLDLEIRTVVVLDPDSYIRNNSTGVHRAHDLEHVLLDFQRSGAAAACPHLSIRGSTLLERLQRLEYALAFSLGRKSLMDHSITSGIAMYRRDALAWVLDQHSLSVYAEDLQNALLLLARGERIYYESRLEVETEGKDTWRGWFSQRVGWYFGQLKVYAASWRTVLRASRRDPYLMYQHFVYNGVLGILLHPLKLATVVILLVSAAGLLDAVIPGSPVPDAVTLSPFYLAAAYAQHLLVIVVAVWLNVPPDSRRSILRIAPFYFPYAVLHLVPVTIGYLNWLTLRSWGRRVFSDHFQDDASLRREILAAGAGR